MRFGNEHFNGRSRGRGPQVNLIDFPHKPDPAEPIKENDGSAAPDSTGYEYMGLTAMEQMCRIREEVARISATDDSLSLAVKFLPDVLSGLEETNPNLFTRKKTRENLGDVLTEAFIHNLRIPKTVAMTEIPDRREYCR